MRVGNLSNAKGVGSGVQEYRIDFGRDIASTSAGMAKDW
jgi:hypothetical protein